MNIKKIMLTILFLTSINLNLSANPDGFGRAFGTAVGLGVLGSALSRDGYYSPYYYDYGYYPYGGYYAPYYRSYYPYRYHRYHYGRPYRRYYRYR
ncbi:hypothetical protein M1446_01055 [Candidatus Dependentiae bacterium]|nr:hypothetical protein [Candidatus Dependentiae bacterium]